MIIKREPQQIFNAAFGGLFRQGKAAYINGMCRYRSDEGLKCGIGQLIDDEDYSSSFEGYDIRNCYEAQEAAGITPDTLKLAQTIQAAHDSMYAKEGRPFLQELWGLAFTIAIAFDLNTDKVFNIYQTALRTSEGSDA